MWHEAGGILFSQAPDLPATAEILGDIGADVATDDSTIHWPQYVPAIMRRILEGWGGETSISVNWDNGVSTPSDPMGAYWYDAGVWLDGTSDRTVRQVLDDGADSIWARYGEDLDAGDWDLYVTGAPPATGGLELTTLEILGLKRVKSILPVGGFVLRGALNYRVLETGEVAGIAADSDEAALTRPHLEATAVVDSTVAVKFPLAEVPDAIDTWLRNIADVRVECQRRYDVLKVEREVFSLDVIMYGYDQNLLNLRVNLTDADFPTLGSGKDFWMIHWKASDEAVNMTLWG